MNQPYVYMYPWGYKVYVCDLYTCSPWGHKESDTTERLNNTTAYIPCFWISFPFRSQSTEYSSPCSRFSLVTYFTHSLVSLSIPISQFIPPFPLGVYTFFSLCLCLYFCFANKIIYTIFLDSTVIKLGHSVMSDSLQPCGLQHTRIACP